MPADTGLASQLQLKTISVTQPAAVTGALRGKCTKAKDGRTLHLHEHDSMLRAARASWAADPELRSDYMTYRPNVERAIAQVGTARGHRLKLRYRDVSGNHAWLKRRTAALNLRNLVGKGPGTPRRRLGALAT